ncbi:MipA/OmpV family protein [Marinobacter sp. VGCF2001]|uniref:MipA/OmpV family protein n=1 Tax=Marinobacter sp. VGCF2001 TaxID=3417189 RepID=UPI003CF9CC27
MKMWSSALSGVALPALAVALIWPVLAEANGAGQEWSVGLGIGAALIPEYRGADTYKTEALPWFQASKGQLSIDPVTGISYDLIASERWKLAPALFYAKGRDNSGDLDAFESVHGGLLAGAIASYTAGSWQITGDVAAPVSGDLDGVRVRGYLRYRGQLADQWRFAVGPGATWANDRWNRSLFDVSASDAARSGLTRYRADDDYLSASFNTRLTYLISDRVSVSTIARYSRLFGDAEDSPIVEAVGDADQWTASVAINYQF